MRETADENKGTTAACSGSVVSVDLVEMYYPRLASLRAAALAVCMCLSTLSLSLYSFTLCTAYKLVGEKERERELWAGAMKPDANLH
jgi:hypothetical protein